jgi:predicted negative regulator of RcsB-dependent stress response
MEHLTTWFMENLFSVIILFLIIAMIGVMIWRSRVSRSNAGVGASYKSEFNVISAVTLVLIIAASVIALQQQNFAVLIEIGIAVLVYAFFMGWISKGRGGRGGR